MRACHPRFHILTGGPGSGKTSVISALRARGFACVDEVGRQIIREQRAQGGNAHHDGDRLAYRELMFSRSLSTYQTASLSQGPVFFDRGLPDLVGYSALIGAPVPDHISIAAAMFRSNKRVFIFPPWIEIYAKDSERGQDFAEAVATWRAMADAYQAMDYDLLEVPRLSVAERVYFILANLREGR